MLADIAADPAITDVVVSYRITSHLATPDRAERARIADALPRILAELRRTKRVIYVMQVPELPATMQKIIRFSPPDAARLDGVARAVWMARRAAFDTLIGPALAPYAVVDATDLFCGAGPCIAGRDGVSLYADDDHMSLAGARMVAAPVLALLARDEAAVMQAGRPVAFVAAPAAGRAPAPAAVAPP